MNMNNLAEQPTEIIESPDVAAVRFASALKAAGDALRLQVLSVLASDSFGVLELCQIFNVKQSGMSHHLKVLARADFVSTRREGNTIFYRRSDTNSSLALEQLRQVIYSNAEALPLQPEILKNLNAVYQQRAEASRNFFRDNSDAFASQQELIASYDVYGPEVCKLLDQSHIHQYKQALEIGPGLGEFLNQLSTRFEHVTALDNSERMLKQSQAHCVQQDLNNIEFICGDTSVCHKHTERYDCAVINMVLHHTPSPKQIFQDVAASLYKGAILIVCDLGEHDQDWVRDACGDQWLGFNANELKSWANKAQLKTGESRYLSLRNGFQIQIHQFIKL